MELFWQTFQIVAPVFLLAFVGMGLKKIRLIDMHFVEITSKLVFTVALPCLVFVKLSIVDFGKLFNLAQIVYICIGTTAMYLMIWITAGFWIHRGEDLGVFIQGGFRSNFAIVGFAIIWNLYGESGLAQAAVIMAFLMPLYNLLAVIVLILTTHNKKSLPVKTFICRIITNPLTLSVLIALIFSLLHWQLHPVLFNTAEILSRLALPMALIGIGGSLNLEAIRNASKMAIASSTIKIIVLPAVLTFGAILTGFRGMELGIMFILFGCPTAVASFVMADAMGANSKLASNIILISTLGATLTITLGVVILTRLDFL